MNSIIPSVNFHLWEPCNMRCKHCFATFQDVKKTILPKGHLPKGKAILLMEELCKTSISKITFAGGEPTLCPWLFDLIKIAKKHGKTTMIVTNGSKINEEWLLKFSTITDWITLSIDSVNNATNLKSGRAITGKRVISKAQYLAMCKLIKDSGIRLKINTVVTSDNCQERMSDFIETTKPERWKIMQVLPIKGQNDSCISELIISKEQFEKFLHQNQCNLSIPIIPESNEDMTDSYLMIDPAGRFFQNTNGTHTYSQPILEVGIKKALAQNFIDESKYVSRGGLYDWEK